MEIGPIWRALMRNKGGSILIALQIAVTMAIMVNAVAIMQERAGLMARPSGIDEANIITVRSTIYAPEADQRTLYIEDLEALRNLPGVVNAIGTNSYPLRGGGWSMGLQTEPGPGIDGVGTAIYFVDEHAVEAFGITIIEGRNFNQDEVAWLDREDSGWQPTAILTKDLAESLFPDETGSYVGKTAYINDNDPVKIVGIVDTLQAPWKGWDDVGNTMLSPLKRDSDHVHYVIRTEPGYRDDLMPQVEALLAGRSKDRLIGQVRTMDEVRKQSYVGDAAMIKMLTFIVVLLTAITGLGIVGLASFNVSRRTRQIGIRRALGASRPSILRHFMVENFLVSSVGIFFGGLLAIALNMFMVQAFAISPMAWYVVPTAMLVLWIVGQIAVAGPARKAASITPAIATRSI